MSAREMPTWLAELQAQLGAVLREPLDRSSGTLRAATERYPDDAVREVVDASNADARARLAVYNRQYWFRLFGVLQTVFPLTARLLGHWDFNDHAAQFLRAEAPRTWSLDDVPRGFERFLERSLAAHPAREALLEAAHIDALWRAVFLAPDCAPLRPRAEDAARLPELRLALAPSVAVLVERWPLLELKGRLGELRGESALALPARLATPRWYALVREDAGIRRLPLEPREGELLTLLQQHTVGEALAQLEARVPPDERVSLPASTQRWLARSVTAGFWAAADPPEGAARQRAERLTGRRS